MVDFWAKMEENREEWLEQENNGIYGYDIYIYILWLIYAGAKLTHKKNSMVLGKYTVTIVNGVKPTHITGGPTLPLFLSGLSARTSSGVEYCVNAVIHKTNGRKQVNFRGHSAMEGIAAQS